VPSFSQPVALALGPESPRRQTEPLSRHAPYPPVEYCYVLFPSRSLFLSSRTHCHDPTARHHISFLSCDTSGNVTTWTDLRVAPVSTIWVTSTLSAAFFILAYRSSVARVPRTLFEYAFPAWFHFHLSLNWHRFANISVLVSSSPRHLSTSSPQPLASSPHGLLPQCSLPEQSPTLFSYLGTNSLSSPT
jgi:hypothetical protein